MSARAILSLSAAAVLALGCTDATNVSRPEDMGGADLPDLAVEQPDFAVDERDAEPVIDASVPVDMAAPRPAWVEVTVDPRRPLYALDDTLEISARVFDRQGEPFDADAFTIDYEVVPEALGTITDGVLSFTGEGPGTVLACADGVCGRAAVFVDSSPPTLTVESPERGAIIDGEGGRTLLVTGTAVDTAGPVDVRVNGEPVAVDDDGRFQAEVRARFGVNRVEVIASDGVQNQASVDVRDVLWAPEYTEVDPRGVTVVGAATLRVDQALLDTNNPIMVPLDAAEVSITDLAQLLDALVQIIDVATLLPDAQLSSGPPLELRIDGVDLGTPVIEMMFTPEGIELFLALPDVAITTTGELVVEDESISLDGSLTARLSAIARVGIRVDGEIAVDVGDVLVNLDEIRGNYESGTANALVESLGTLLGNIVRDLAADLVGGVVQDQLPALIDAALASVLDTISVIPLAFDTGIDGAPPIDLELRITPAAVALRRGEMMQLVLDARIEHRVDVVAPYPDPGVPTLSRPEWDEVAGDGIGVSVRLAMLNGLLHEVWRTGLLQLSPPLPEEAAPLLGEVFIDATTPPVVAPAPLGAALPLEVQIGDLRLSTQGLAADAPDIYALSVRVGAGVDVDGAQLALELGEDPDIEAVLIEQASQRPVLSEDVLARLIEAAVWPMVQDALGEGLAFGIDPIEVDPAALADYAPRLRGLTLAPRFREAARIEQGRLTLEGNIIVHMDVGPADGLPDEPPPEDLPPEDMPAPE